MITLTDKEAEDIRQAINLIKKEHGKIGANIDYVEPYKIEHKKKVTRICIVDCNSIV